MKFEIKRFHHHTCTSSFASARNQEDRPDGIGRRPETDAAVSGVCSRSRSTKICSGGAQRDQMHSRIKRHPKWVERDQRRGTGNPSPNITTSGDVSKPGSKKENVKKIRMGKQAPSVLHIPTTA